MLKPYQARALRELTGNGGGFRVGGTRGVCSERCYAVLWRKSLKRRQGLGGAR